MGLDSGGQLTEVGRYGQFHVDGQLHESGNTTRSKETAFSCAEIRAKYDSEQSKKHTSEEVLCLDISRANGTASCCRDSPKTCCMNSEKCTLEDVFGALDMLTLCNTSALVESVQVDDPRGNEEGDDVADNGAAEVLGDKETKTKLEEEDTMATSSIMATIDWTVGLPEQKRQLVQKLEALRDENLKHPRSQVKDSLLSSGSGYLTYALEELRRDDLFEARSNASAAPRPLYTGTIPNNLQPFEFQQRVAGAAAGAFMNLVQGKGNALEFLASTSLDIVSRINPALSFFAGIFLSLLGGGNSQEALINKIMTEVDKKSEGPKLVVSTSS
jgi:hypothetical protein